MAVKRAGDTELGLDAHDSSLHVIEGTGCAEPARVRKPRPTGPDELRARPWRSRVRLPKGGGRLAP